MERTKALHDTEFYFASIYLFDLKPSPPPPITVQSIVRHNLKYTIN